MNLTKMTICKCLSLAYMFTISCVCGLTVIAQKNSIIPIDSTGLMRQNEISYYKHQMDLIDIGLLTLHKEPNKRIDSNGLKNMKIHVSAAPILEYTLATGFASGVAANGAFFTSGLQPTNTSSILIAIKYTQKKQFLLPIQSSIWTQSNKYDLLGDWRYLNYPQDTYGFGGHTTLADAYIVTYKYIRFYEFVLKSIRKNVYLGFGYQLDDHWGIKELNLPLGRVTDFQKYGYNSSSLSSGLVIEILYDSRKSSIDPEGGSFFGNLQFLQNSTILGSTSNWNSVLLDLRKYIKLPHNNVLAFWSYNVITLSGNPPFLDLPGTASDTYNNSGRGYEQSRFIGKKMIDLEVEFRFGITHNGLLGGVVFANAESLSELNSNKFQVVSPAIGVGLRLKFNKFSHTNVCLDYGFGTGGSHGFFGNLGEVF
jgi:hypothetical protein